MAIGGEKFNPPTDIRGYELRESPFLYLDMPDLGIKPENMYKPQAALFRPPGFDYWRFGIKPGLPVRVEGKILRDAIRLITGHARAYTTKLDPMFTIANAEIWLWDNVE